MSAISNITAFDGAATPVSHTLIATEVTRKNGKVSAVWRENATGVPVYAQIRVEMNLERLASGVYRVEQRTVVPVQEVVTGANSAGYSATPKVAHEMTVLTTGFFHERSDSAGRQLVKQLAANIFNGVATSVTPVTTGPVAELFTLLVAPT